MTITRDISKVTHEELMNNLQNAKDEIKVSVFENGSFRVELNDNGSYTLRDTRTNNTITINATVANMLKDYLSEKFPETILI